MSYCGRRNFDKRTIFNYNNYLEQAKNLLYLHPNVRNYTFSQKIDYLGSPFFNDGVITIFIDEIFSLLLA